MSRLRLPVIGLLALVASLGVAPGASAVMGGTTATRPYPGIGGVTTSDDLREVTVPMVSDADCDTSYNTTGITGEFFPQTMVCAGELYGTKDSCSGDSGGPLMVPDAQGTLVQAGTVSWGFACGVPTQYGVYGRIGADPLHAWIPPRIGPVPAPAQTAPPP